MRRSKSNQSRKPVPWLMLISVCLILALVYGIFGRVFVVATITCSIEGSSCPQGIQEQLDAELLGNSLFFSNHQQQLTSVQLSQPIELQQITKQLPSRLHISFTSTEPVYALQLGDTEYLVDTAGRMSSQSNPPADQAYSVIFFAGPETEIHTDTIVVEKYHQFILDLLQQLTEHRITATSIEIVDVMETRLVVADEHVYILDSTNPAQQVQKIEYIRKYLQTNTIEVLAPFEIDVRFRQPVLRSRQ